MELFSPRRQDGALKEGHIHFGFMIAPHRQQTGTGTFEDPIKLCIVGRLRAGISTVQDEIRGLGTLPAGVGCISNLLEDLAIPVESDVIVGDDGKSPGFRGEGRNSQEYE
jgi:hypothetical protein